VIAAAVHPVGLVVFDSAATRRQFSERAWLVALVLAA
jgi:hypothetical protein